jgi:hypothetical protein
MENMEKRVIELVAADRLYIPISSMSGKLQRARPKLAKATGLNDGDEFFGERTYARVESGETMNARGMKDGIEKFSTEFPRHGKILKGYIEEQRAKSETNLYFGMNPGTRLNQDDYLSVMSDLGFSESAARNLYQPLMDASRNISRARNGEERSVLIK